MEYIIAIILYTVTFASGLWLIHFSLGMPMDFLSCVAAGVGVNLLILVMRNLCAKGLSC